MNTYVPIFRGLDARGGRKLRTDTHTHTNTRDNHSNPRCAHARRGLINYYYTSPLSGDIHTQATIHNTANSIHSYSTCIDKFSCLSSSVISTLRNSSLVRNRSSSQVCRLLHCMVSLVLFESDEFNVLGNVRFFQWLGGSGSGSEQRRSTTARQLRWITHSGVFT